ncbi:hypothetical protein JCM9279_004478 [Rhodotorula babjevae]
MLHRLRRVRPPRPRPPRPAHAAPYYSSAPPLHAEFERHPAFLDLSSELDAAGLPAFAAHGESCVSVLHEPKDFYQSLLTKIATAKRRIFIASLYVGKEETELVGALHTALRHNPSLRLTLLVDYLRSTREHPGASSAALLASLAAAFPDQVDLRLFHTPALYGWQKRWVPKRFNEGWGLQHMKVYGFDDDVIMSGANLSHDYFTNRADRYIAFEQHAPLANFFDSLVHAVGSYSFRATATDTTSPTPTPTLSWPTPNAVPDDPFAARRPGAALADLRAHAHDALSTLLRTWHALSPSARAASLPPALLATERPFSRRTQRPSAPGAAHLHPAFDTLLRPVLQMAPFALAHETDQVVPGVFRAANALATAPGGQGTTLDWTSGYFGLREDYRRLAIECDARIRIVSAAPEANGFHNSRGVSRFIPPAYTYFSQRFYDQVQAYTRRKRRDEPRVEMSEWKRDGWTYHAKGIWLAPSVSNPFSPATPTSLSTTLLGSSHDAQTHDLALRLSHPSPPFLSLVGSSNFGARSATRDLEAGVLVTTHSTQLRWALEGEVRRIRAWCKGGDVTQQLFERDDRKVPWLVKVAARRIEGML